MIFFNSFSVSVSVYISFNFALSIKYNIILLSYKNLYFLFKKDSSLFLVPKVQSRAKPTDQWFHLREDIPEMVQIKRQLKEMRSSVNLQKVRRFRMFIEVNKKRIQIETIKIPGNGSCLFSAIHQQMNKVCVTSPDFDNDVQLLRKNVIEYIKNKQEEFDTELKNTIADYNACKYDDVTGADINYYLEHTMILPATWGGTETIKAVSEMFNVNVLVFTEDAKKHNFYKFDENKIQTIIVAYRKTRTPGSRHQFDHYDSVVGLVNDITVGNIVQGMITEERISIDTGNDAV